MTKRPDTAEEPRLFEDPPDAIWDNPDTDPGKPNPFYAPGLEAKKDDEEKEEGDVYRGKGW